MKFKVGSKYKCRNGKVVTIKSIGERIMSTEEKVFYDKGNVATSYCTDGTIYSNREGEYDIVSECNTEDEDVTKSNRPDVEHYKEGDIQPIDLINSFNMNFNLGNIVKYATRAPYKGQTESDLNKIIDYAKFELERLEMSYND